MILWKSSTGALAAAVVLAVPFATARADEKIGTSCADCPSYEAAFSIANDTGVLIHYQVRWGDRNDWKRINLAPSHMETHRYPLGGSAQGRAPVPFVRFDDVADGNRTTFKEYRIEFHAVGYAGYGPKANKTEPKRYHFEYSGNGRRLDLKAN